VFLLVIFFGGIVVLELRSPQTAPIDADGIPINKFVNERMSRSGMPRGKRKRHRGFLRGNSGEDRRKTTAGVRRRQSKVCTK
jgi:hypothetical protein